MPLICLELLEMLTSKAGVLETLRALPESHRQYVDHSNVIPYLWDELGEIDPRAKNAAKVILQYLYHFSVRVSAVKIDFLRFFRNYLQKFRNFLNKEIWDYIFSLI